MSEVSVSREIAADLFDFQVDTLIIGAVRLPAWWRRSRHMRPGARC